MVSGEEILERPRTPGSKTEDPTPQTKTSVEKSFPEDGPAEPHICLICMQPVHRSGADMMRCREDETSICVTGLSKNTCEKDLYNLGCQFGFITSITLALDEKAGSHTQIGIVKFEERDDAEEAIKWLNGHSYDNLPLEVYWATPELKESSVPVLKEAHDPAPVCETCMQVVEVSVHVTNLPENTCERDLYNLFCQFGFINRYYLGLDEKAGSRILGMFASDPAGSCVSQASISAPGAVTRNRAPESAAWPWQNFQDGKQTSMLCGIVEFEQREDAEVAISWVNGHVYGGNNLQVKWATAAVLSGHSV